MPSDQITVSIIKADIGSVAGHNRPHPDMLKKAQDCPAAAKAKGLLVDFFVARGGDDIDLIMTHRHGPFEPHRLPLEEMEYTMLPQIMGRLADRFKAV